MVVNELLKVDHLEKRIVQDTTEISKVMASFEEEYQQYRSDVSESWSPHIFQIEQKYEVVEKQQEYKKSGKNAYVYSVAMFNAMSRFCNMRGQKT